MSAVRGDPLRAPLLRPRDGHRRQARELRPSWAPHRLRQSVGMNFAAAAAGRPNLVDILIVDDDHEASDRLANILAAAGHLTRVASHGLEGLRQLATDPPDIILLDVEVPILDFPGMTDALAAQRAGSIPVVLMSASRDLEKIAGSIGTPYYLKKPFGIGQVIGLVKEAIDARPLMDR